MKSNPSQDADACAEELKTRFGLSDECINNVMEATTILSNFIEEALLLMAVKEAQSRGIDTHEVYHDIDLALGTSYLRLIEGCASSCPLHGDKYATL